MFGIRQRGFQTAQSFAQLGQDVFRFGGSRVIDEQVAVAGVKHRFCTAAAGKRSGQQVVCNLLFKLLFFFATDIAGFIVLDFRYLLFQNIADDAGRQDFSSFSGRRAR